MSEQKLRKFRLIDEQGYKDYASINATLLKCHLRDGCFEGFVDDGHLFHSKDFRSALITRSEFQFFEEIPSEELETLSNDNEPPSNNISDTFSDEMIHCIKEDCHAVNGSLCFYKEGVVFLWNEDEYFIESVEDYNKVVNSIKVLNSFKK